MAPNRLCLITALAPVPAFLGGSCPLGCSLSAPAAGGCSVVSLQWSMYAAGSEKEKRAGCPLHGGTIAQLFVFCKGGCGRGPGLRRADVDGDGWSWLGVRPPSAGGLAWRAPLSHRPTLQRFWKQGDTPCTPGGAAPLHPAWGAGFCFGVRSPSAEGLAWRAPLSHLPTLQRFWVQGDTPCTPGGGCAPCTPLGGGRRRFLAWRVGTLPGLPAGAGAGMGACLRY